MSYTIEYNRQIFKMPAGTLIPAGYGKIEHKLHEDDYFMFVKSGCNNIDPRPQNWNLAAWGWTYKVIQTVCERAGWTESGCLKFQNGDTKPENYLKLYRRQISEAVEFSVEALHKLTGIYGGYICLGKKEIKKGYYQQSIDEMKIRFLDCGTRYDYQRFSIAFKTIDDFRCFIHYSSLAEHTDGYIGMASIQNK